MRRSHRPEGPVLEVHADAEPRDPRAQVRAETRNVVAAALRFPVDFRVAIEHVEDIRDELQRTTPEPKVLRRAEVEVPQRLETNRVELLVKLSNVLDGQKPKNRDRAVDVTKGGTYADSPAVTESGKRKSGTSMGPRSHPYRRDAPALPEGPYRRRPSTMLRAT